MADVRSLLRNELAARKGSSTTNTAGSRLTKKRKAKTIEDVSSKRFRSTDLALEVVSPSLHITQPQSPLDKPADDVEEDGGEVTSADESERFPSNQVSVDPTIEASTQSKIGNSQAVNEDEWAAFEREVVAPTRVSRAPAAVAAAPTISAAPISAEDLAAQEQPRRETMSSAREAQAMGEREDAARFLEDEFEEMEQLEERVKRLKQRRESLRRKIIAPEPNTNQEQTTGSTAEDQQTTGDSIESDSEDDDRDWDDWQF